MLSGASTRVPRTNASLHLDRFFYKIQPTPTKSGIVYQPIDYVSDLRITDREGRTRAVRLRVNQPVDIDDVLYYQSGYGFAIDLAVTRNGRPLPAMSATDVRETDAIPIETGGRALEYARFVPSIDPLTGKPSPDPRIGTLSGVVLAITDEERALGEALVPFGTSVDLGDGLRVTPTRWRLYTGLQYRHDPGIPLVGLGAIVLLVGLCISFYLVPARLYVRVDGADQEWRVGIAATSVRGYDLYEQHFRELVAAFERDELRAPKPVAVAVAT